MTIVYQNIKCSGDGRRLKKDGCDHFRPAKPENWGIRRITCPDPIPDVTKDLKPWPCYRYEPEMDVDIYIMDTGILTTHDEFQEHGKSRAQCLFAADDVGGVCVDDHGHGTHVAGIAVGKVYGVAKKASVIGVKVLDKNNSGSVCGFLSGLEWIVNTVTAKRKDNNRQSVINIALGMNRIALIDNAVKNTLDENIPVVLAAGNDAKDACIYSPAAVGGGNGNAITVMASDINDELASDSNCGTCTDIIAPGVNIKSAINTGPAHYADAQGTSHAAPYVSGLVARYLAQNKGKTPAELKAWVTTKKAAKGLVKIRDNCPDGTPNLLAQSGCYLQS